MSKPQHKRSLSDTQAQAVGRNIRTSPRKLNLVAQSIRGLPAESALQELSFSRKLIAGTVKTVLQSAIANAVNNHDLPVVQALAMLIAAVYVVLNLAADVATILVTPRLRTRL